MVKRWLMLVLVLLVAVFGRAWAADGEANLLVNSDFERGTPGQEPVDWTRESSCTSPSVAVTTEKAHRGAASVKMKADSPCDVRIIQTVPVSPNTYYRFSGWIATADVTPEKTGAILCIMGGYDITPSVNATTDWTYVELNFRTHESQNEIALAARLGMWGSEVTGTAWFDDLNLVRLQEAPDSYIQLSGPKTSEPAAQDSGSGGGGVYIWFVIAIAVIGLQVFLFIKKKKNAKTE
ncbi:MAG: carbohydrate binding domain-containing protein [Bacteroidota bacterium]